MADYEIVREAADGYSHQGHTVSYTDAYIKVRRSFLNEALRTLKGPPLSVFLAVSLSIEPPDDDTICSLTGFHQWSVGKALDYLISHSFIEELPRAGPNGHKLYRPIRYAWSGSDKNAPPLEKDGTITIRRARVARHDMNDDVLNETSLEGSFIHETRAILAECCIAGKNLDLLAGKVRPEVAREWSDWLAAVNRTLWTRPEGYCFKKLSVDPNARPPAFQSQKPAQEQRNARRAQISGHLAGLFDESEEPTDAN